MAALDAITEIVPRLNYQAIRAAFVGSRLVSSLFLEAAWNEERISAALFSDALPTDGDVGAGQITEVLCLTIVPRRSSHPRLT